MVQLLLLLLLNYYYYYYYYCNNGRHFFPVVVRRSTTKLLPVVCVGDFITPRQRRLAGREPLCGVNTLLFPRRVLLVTLVFVVCVRVCVLTCVLFFS